MVSHTLHPTPSWCNHSLVKKKSVFKKHEESVTNQRNLLYRGAPKITSYTESTKKDVKAAEIRFALTMAWHASFTGYTLSIFNLF